MNDYAVWKEGNRSDVSSLFDQIHPPEREEFENASVPSDNRINIDTRSHPDYLSHLAHAVGNINIGGENGRGQPPHQTSYPLPPICQLPVQMPMQNPYPYQNAPHPLQPFPPPHSFQNPPFQPPCSNFLPFPQALSHFFHPHFFQPNPYHAAPPPPPPPPQHFAPTDPAPRQPTPRPMMSYIPEPRIRDGLRYAGEPRLLRQFLLDIYDTINRYSDSFTTDKRKINWVVAHFGSTTPAKTPTSSQSWFLALLERNALSLGITDSYANLKGLKYVEPALTSFSAFIAELINTFGDRMSAKSAREALEECMQGDTTVVD